MARPELLARLHAAWYDTLMAAEDAPERLHEWRAVRDECCREWNCSIEELQVAVRGDFSKWMREMGLPKPPPKRDSTSFQ